MLNIALKSLQIFYIIVLRAEIVTTFGSKITAGRLMKRIPLGLRWCSGQSARLSPLRLRVRLLERTFSMLLEPSSSLM